MPNLTNDLQIIRSELRRRSELPLETLAAEFARPCRFCGAVITPEIREVAHPLKNGVMSRLPIFPDLHGCPAETASLAQRAELEKYTREQMEREAWAYVLNRAGLVGWLGKATFNTFQPRDDWAGAMHTCGRVKAYSYALLNGGLDKPFLIMHGAWGTGKSHLAAAVVRDALEAGWNEVYFRVWTEYLSRLQSAWNRRRDGAEGETEYDIEAELKDGKLVVIDDLDKRRPTGWTKEILVGVINYRYNAKLPTALTFNYGPEDFDPKAAGKLALVEYLGEAVLDRLIGDTFDTIEFSAPSYRSGVDWAQAA